MDETMETLLRTAVRASSRSEARGGMASVKVEWNPYMSRWKAEANWSSGEKIAHYADDVSEAVSDLMTALTTPVPTT